MEAAPISLFLAMIWLTVFGMLNKLQLGALILIPCVIFFALVLYKSNPSKFSFIQLKEFFSFPVLSFVIVTSWAYLNTQNMQFIQWDEFTHWGASVKSMYLFDAIGPYSPARLNNPGYPPGLAVLSYLVLQLRNSWDESVIFWTYHVLFFSIIFAVIAKFNFKKIWYAIFSCVILLVSSVIFYDFFQTVYADPLLSVVFGYSLFLAIDKRTAKNKFALIGFLITVSSLFLIKEIGFVLGAISALVFSFNYVYCKRNEIFKNKLSLLRNLLLLGLALFVSVLLMRFTWTQFVCSRDYQQGASVETTCGTGSSNPLLMDSTVTEWSLFKSYVSFVKEKPITFWNGIELSTFHWLVLIIVFLVIFIFENKAERIQRLTVSLAIIFGSFIYFASVFVAYLSFFGTTAQGFPSFDRYVSTYLAGVIFFFACQATAEIFKNLKELEPNKLLKIPKIVFVMLLLIIFYAPQGRLTFYVKQPESISDQLRSQFAQIKQKIQFAQFSVEDDIYVITQHRNGFEYYYLQYESLPASVGAMPFSIGSDGGEADFWTDPNMTLDLWNQTLTNYDYVIIYNLSESFVKEYGSMFEDPTQIEEQTIYLVKHLDTGNKLVKYI